MGLPPSPQKLQIRLRLDSVLSKPSLRIYLPPILIAMFADDKALLYINLCLTDPSAGIRHGQRQDRSTPPTYRFTGCTLWNASGGCDRAEAQGWFDMVCHCFLPTPRADFLPVNSRGSKNDYGRHMRYCSGLAIPSKTMGTHTDFLRIYKR